MHKGHGGFYSLYGIGMDCMGTIYVIHNIKIYLYAGDHNPPHIHAFYGEYEVVIVIKNGAIMKGFIPKPQLRQVYEWLEDPAVKTKLIDWFHQLNPDLRG
ncbi:MAG TPA: DUF4160 domain-containing protein [Bacteroidia bacterium]|nr:DUF4160 domain-containing protein [Bacteroidia bacterium]